MAYAAAAVRVLFVEPDADTRDLYALWLSGLGWHVTTAADGAGAAAALLSDRPDVLVCELRLPDRAVAPLLALAHAAGVPVIALTTAPANQHEQVAQSSLAALLMKPIEPDAVVAAIVMLAPGQNR